MWAIFKVFVEFFTILFLFHALVFWLRGMWGLISPSRDRIHTLCIGRQSLNRWATWEGPIVGIFTPQELANAANEGIKKY